MLVKLDHFPEKSRGNNYPSSHNHGSVKHGCIFKAPVWVPWNFLKFYPCMSSFEVDIYPLVASISNAAIFHWTMVMEEGVRRFETTT